MKSNNIVVTKMPCRHILFMFICLIMKYILIKFVDTTESENAAYCIQTGNAYEQFGTNYLL